jgi:hypothetical protein
LSWDNAIAEPKHPVENKGLRVASDTIVTKGDAGQSTLRYTELLDLRGCHQSEYARPSVTRRPGLTTKQRALNLCAKLRDAGLASARFWFTDLSAIPTDKPETILEKIFFTPKDFEGCTLYSFQD